jgi:hypothetical protein
MTVSEKQSELVMPWEKSWIPRLNALLRFVKVDPWKLTDGDWEKLLDDLYFVLNNMKRSQEDVPFHKAANRDGVRKAYYGLKDHLEANDVTAFHLGEMDLHVDHHDDGRFVYWFTSKDLETMLYVELAHLLELSGLRWGDIIRCSHCNTWFVPRRRPKKGSAVYCSRKCANVVMARNFRARASKRKAKKKK